MQTVALRLEHVEAKLKRWHTRLKRASNVIVKLERQRRRLTGLAPLPTSDKVVAVVKVKVPTPKPVAIEATMPPVVAVKSDLDVVPDFLRRTPLDPKAKAIIEANAAEKKDRASRRAKARASIKKAKLSGATRKMPLSGKEALAFIRQG